MSMGYSFKSLHDIAQLFRQRAERIREELDANPRTTSVVRNARLNEQNIWLAAGDILRRTVLVDPPIAEEYAVAYAEAQDSAGWHIWASMQRHAGDPRWEYDTSGRYGMQANDYERKT